MAAVLWAVAAYLLGGLPVARFVSSRLRAETVRVAAVALAEVLLGAIAVTWAPTSGGLLGQVLAATAVLAGHQWPFTGAPRGRGLTVAAGALLVASPLAVPVWAVLWGLGFVVTGFPAVGRTAASMLTAPLVGYIAGWPLGLGCVSVCLLLLEQERGPMRRVLLGTEPPHVWRPGS